MERQTCLRISTELPMLLKTTSYSDLSMVEQGQAVNLCHRRRVEIGRVKTYQLGPSPAIRSTPPVSFGAESQACRTGNSEEGRRTCGGGFLPLPEEEEENISGADDGEQGGTENAVLRNSTHGRCWFVV